jgi:hypothetical protein
VHTDAPESSPSPMRSAMETVIEPVLAP